MVEEPISLSFAFRPRSNIGTDKSAVYVVMRYPTAYALSLFT